MQSDKQPCKLRMQLLHNFAHNIEIGLAEPEESEYFSRILSGFPLFCFALHRNE